MFNRIPEKIWGDQHKKFMLHKAQVMDCKISKIFFSAKIMDWQQELSMEAPTSFPEISDPPRAKECQLDI